MEQQNLPIIDWTKTLKITGNDKKEVEEMLTEVTVSLQEDISHLTKLIEAKDYLNLRPIVHRIRSLSAYFGLVRFSFTCEAFERDLERRIFSNVTTHLHQVNIEMSAFVER